MWHEEKYFCLAYNKSSNEISEAELPKSQSSLRSLFSKETVIITAGSSHFPLGPPLTIFSMFLAGGETNLLTSLCFLTISFCTSFRVVDRASKPGF